MGLGSKRFNCVLDLNRGVPGPMCPDVRIPLISKAWRFFTIPVRPGLPVDVPGIGHIGIFDLFDQKKSVKRVY